MHCKNTKKRNKCKTYYTGMTLQFPKPDGFLQGFHNSHNVSWLCSKLERHGLLLFYCIKLLNKNKTYQFHMQVTYCPQSHNICNTEYFQNLIFRKQASKAFQLLLKCMKQTYGSKLKDQNHQNQTILFNTTFNTLPILFPSHPKASKL